MDVRKYEKMIWEKNIVNITVEPTKPVKKSKKK
jgi:hypothetical protein